MSRDTTREAARIQTEVHRKMGPGGRLDAACQMSEMVREFALARIRAANPGLDERGVRDLLIWELYGIRRSSE